MTLYSYNFEDGADETSYVIDTPAVTAPIVADDAQAAHGSLSLRTDNATGYQFVQKNFSASVTDAAARFYFYEDTAVTSNSELFRFQASTTTVTNTDCAARLTLSGANKLRVQDNAGTILWTSANAFSTGTWYRLEIRVQCNTSGAAAISGAYYAADSTTATETFTITTATTTAMIISARVGKTATGSTNPTTGHIWVDDWAIDDAPTGFIGPYAAPTNTAPVAQAGSDQTNLQPYVLVTLDGSGSTDADDDTLTYQWAQLNGPTVTLDDATSPTPTFTAPATSNGATLTFQLIVNDGTENSAADTVAVAVLPHALWQITDPSVPTLRPINTSLLSINSPPTDPGDPGEPEDWQTAVDSRDYTTMQNWYVANTGFEAAGYALGDLTSGTIVSQYDGQVFEGISASVVRIGHNNVTVRGCLIQGGGTYGYYNNPTFGSVLIGTVIEYCTFIGGDPAIDKAAILCESDPSAGIAATFRNCEITGWSSGFLANGGVAVEYCYIHDFYPSSVQGAHVSSMVARGSNVRFYRNYATEGGSPICSIYFDQRTVANVTIQQNILSARMSVSGNLPSYLLFGKTGSYESSATNIVVGGNYLGDTAGTDFQFGQTAGMGAVQWGSNGNAKSDNINFLTGGTIPY